MTNVRFERPVFIMAAPRSCSTLLFQTLSECADLWSIGDEAHHLIEQFPQFSPLQGSVKSNRLTAEYLDTASLDAVRTAFARQLRDRTGNPPARNGSGTVRLLEKTPKNSLRIPFLNALFPDALFIYLVRDPKENISSIIDAWRSGRFVTYPSLRSAHGPWSLLLPPGWHDHVDKPLEEIAAFQWAQANGYILRDLEELPAERYITINAAQLLQDPYALVHKLCNFMGVTVDERFEQYLRQPLPMSYHTLSPPTENKWLKNAPLLRRIWPEVCALVPDINLFAGNDMLPLSSDPPPAARNESCPCGSGLRYKACHGRLD